MFRIESIVSWGCSRYWILDTKNLRIKVDDKVGEDYPHHSTPSFAECVAPGPAQTNGTSRSGSIMFCINRRTEGFWHVGTAHHYASEAG